MNNPLLCSESFERAAYTHVQAMEAFRIDTTGMEQAVRDFSAVVDKFARILGMQAENDQRKATGNSMAYTEKDFLNA